MFSFFLIRKLKRFVNLEIETFKNSWEKLMQRKISDTYFKILKLDNYQDNNKIGRKKIENYKI